MTRAVQLCRAGEAGRPRPNNGDFLAGPLLGRLRSHPSLGKAVVDDRAFDGLDRHRQLIQAEHAGAFAWSRTNATGEFRKIVGLVKSMQCLFPQPTVNQIIPFRDQIVDRTARSHAADQLTGVAERNAAIHATRALLLQLRFGEVLVELLPIFHPLKRGAVCGEFPLVFHESGWFTHLSSFS